MQAHYLKSNLKTVNFSFKKKKNQKVCVSTEVSETERHGVIF